ncbi:hydroperoxide isomerase ALOXE3-like [Archocentrus centrarchus]|uniref:hydroperoxide isomerase ALOXE3-like n=1 Tax=Archocentrus centrarchus TaxID=63155 RepID=UPI0011EA2F51|nr:hydroperoxide isomerase ALOXE3-like [Archocentrus centrarchus]
MGDYEVIVFTGGCYSASTFNKVYIKLVGTDGASERTHLWSCVPSFYRGAVSHFIVSCQKSLGQLVLIELDKERHTLSPNKAWFPAKVHVTSPEGESYLFPVYQWISDSNTHYFREGAARTLIEDKHRLLGQYSREKELVQRQKVYSWDKQGIAHFKADSLLLLPYDIRFSLTKTAEMIYTGATGLGKLGLMGLLQCNKFTCLEDIYNLLNVHKTQVSEYVYKNWKKDAFFGYQFLNGTNPMLIERCKALPENFPVSDKMVFSNSQHHLEDEIEKGHIFLCDYKLLDGVEPNIISGKQQYLTAPLVLLWKNDEDELVPVAIQLKQNPGEDNPIFYPSDSEYDWLMAKTFVRSANFNLYELDAHLLRTHLLAEIFAVSLLRNIPMVHPLYKLLIPHTRFTLNINFLARKRLISKGGSFDKFTSSGAEGALTILKRSLPSVTYSSLCIPDDITERGLTHVPNFYYRDDGLRLWEIIHRFVSSILTFYYKDDADVQHDTELQNWIKEIFEHGFNSIESTGIPQKFTTVAETVKFVTMVIFTCSAQHSAVNAGQYDFGGWMPNSPTTLDLPPPTKKGTTSEQTMLEAFPSVGTTVHAMASIWLLSMQSFDTVLLGQYPEKHFTERFPVLKIKEFQEELRKLSEDIKSRNSGLDLPYTYLDPDVVENSVSI